MHTDISIFVFKISNYTGTAFGRGSFAGEQEVIRWSEVIPHDITAVTLFGEADTVQYEVRNHEGKHSTSVFNRDVVFRFIWLICKNRDRLIFQAGWLATLYYAEHVHMFRSVLPICV